MKSSTEAPSLIYHSLLARHKEILKSNQFARELEQKYNKSRRKHIRIFSTARAKPDPPRLKYPVESSYFIQALKSKLNEPTPFRPPSDFEQPKRTLEYIRRTLLASYRKSYSFSRSSQEASEPPLLRLNPVRSDFTSISNLKVKQPNPQREQIKRQLSSRSYRSTPHPITVRIHAKPKYWYVSCIHFNPEIYFRYLNVMLIKEKLTVNQWHTSIILHYRMKTSLPMLTNTLNWKQLA